MAYIYCIENLINGKRYVGETTYPIQKRWQEHCRFSRRECSDRPLYRAMRKYGLENFTVYQLEECEDSIRWEREKFWVSTLNSFHSGYNATIGGDGGSTLEIDKKTFIKMYEGFYSPQELAEYFNCCPDTISNYAKKFNISFKGWNQRNPVVAFAEGFEKHFYSSLDAARWLIQEGYSTAKADSISINIMRCCKGQRKSAYKFIWKFDE